MHSLMSFNSLRERLRAKLHRADEPDVGDKSARQAAVALILRQNLGACELLIIKRAIRAGDHWSGNLALPGGRWQAEDPDLLHTARRETMEEVGIDLSLGETLGRLDVLKPRNPLVPPIDVTPFVFAAPAAFHILESNTEPHALSLNHEVAAAFWVSIDYLESEGLSDVFHLVIEGEQRSWPAYPSEHGPIWGMTERMLTDFLKLAT